MVVFIADGGPKYPINLRTDRRQRQKIPHPVEERQCQHDGPKIGARQLAEGDDQDGFEIFIFRRRARIRVNHNGFKFAKPMPPFPIERKGIVDDAAGGGGEAAPKPDNLPGLGMRSLSHRRKQRGVHNPIDDGFKFVAETGREILGAGDFPIAIVEQIIEEQEYAAQNSVPVSAFKKAIGSEQSE